MKISVTLSNLQKAIKALQRYKSDLVRKIDTFRERVGREIATKAEDLFAGSLVDIKDDLQGSPKTPDVKVTVSDQGKVTVVIAKGKDAVFVEFGAGIYSNAKPSPHPLGAELGMTIGSYGEGKGNRDTWGFYNENGELELTHGTPATMPMYRAMTEVCRDIDTIAKEVFG